MAVSTVTAPRPGGKSAFEKDEFLSMDDCSLSSERTFARLSKVELVSMDTDSTFENAPKKESRPQIEAGFPGFAAL